MTAPLLPNDSDAQLEEAPEIRRSTALSPMEELGSRRDESAAAAPSTAPAKKPRRFRSQQEWRDHMERQSSGGPGKEWRSKNWQ